MKQEKTYYIVRGTNSGLDGSVVSIEYVGEDDYCFILPYGKIGKISIIPISLHRKYLQELREEKTYSYHIQIKKFDETGKEVENEWFNIQDTFKNIKCSSIKTFIEMNIKPLLQMD